MNRSLLSSAVLALAVTLASCSQNAGGGSPLPGGMAPNTPSISVPFSIAIPQPTGVQPLYISSATKSASLTVNSGAAVVVNCTTTCSGTILAPISTDDSFTAKLYDQTNGVGNILSQGTMIQAIVASQANNVHIIFGGVVANVAFTVTPTAQFSIGTAGTASIAITAKDASGAAITGTYNAPITLTNSDTTGSTTLSSTNVIASGTSVTLSYSGTAAYTGSTITASVGSATAGTTVIPAPLACYVSTNTSIVGYQPCDLDSAYNLPLPASSSGTGETIAILDEYHDPNAEADMQAYRNAFKLPACTSANGCFKQLDVTGATAPTAVDPTGGWEAEESLDIDMVSAVCPNCHILVLEAGPTDLVYAGISTAKSLGATEVSMSFGNAESGSGPYAGTYLQYYDVNYLANAGIPLVAAAGDAGYGPLYPSTSQYAVSVGGTRLVKSSTARGWTETVWYDSATLATGGGCSGYEPKPTWQIDTSCNNRIANDVSAVGDPNTSVAIYDTYPATGWRVGWGGAGGTSASTPIIASVYALGNDTDGVVAASRAYSHASSLNDVTSGSSGTCAVFYYCNAQVSYDGPSGMGTPNGLGAFGGTTPSRVTAQAFARQMTQRTVPFLSTAKGIARGCTVPTGPAGVMCLIEIVRQ